MGGCAMGTELFRLSTPSNAEIAKRRLECHGSMKHDRGKGSFKKYESK